MSRFKFRAWNKESKIMVYDNEDKSADYWDGVCCSDIKIVNKRLGQKDTYIWQQCTGVKDIDKQLIYEGDICAVTYCDIDGSPYNNVLIREVKWKNSGYRLCENFAGTELSSSLTTKDIFSVKVIGNIYEGVKDGLS